METTAELNTEESLPSAAMAADYAPPEPTGDEVDQAPALAVSEPEAVHEPEATAQAGEAVRAEPPVSPKLDIISFIPLSERTPRIEAPPPKASRNFVAPALAAGLALVLLLGAGAVYEQMRQSALLAAKIRQNAHLVSTVKNLTERLDAIEAVHAREESAEVRKLLGEIKLGASATRDVSAAVTQLSARVDHVEHDQGARLDKLAERTEHDASSRFADLTARLDKLEKKAASPTVAAVAPDHDASPRFVDLAVRLDKLEKKAASPAVVAIAPVPPGPPPKPIPTPAKVEPSVSDETTASIEKPKPPLRGYSVIGVGDGFATIRGREGTISVGAGDMIPGLGRVLRIERHGREWFVVTSVGVISGAGGPY
jgi:hypothetical protein